MHVEAEVVSKSKNKIHETWAPPISGALYIYVCVELKKVEKYWSTLTLKNEPTDGQLIHWVRSLLPDILRVKIKVVFCRSRACPESILGKSHVSQSACLVSVLSANHKSRKFHVMWHDPLHGQRSLPLRKFCNLNTCVHIVRKKLDILWSWSWRVY